MIHTFGAGQGPGAVWDRAKTELREDAAPAASFSSMLEEQFNAVDQLLGDADKKAAEVATGKNENLHDAMISFEKAESALKLLMQVRNKALEAYNEILRMPL